MSPEIVTAGDPKPISSALDRHLTDVLAKIPTGKRGQVHGAISNKGVEAGIGIKLGTNGAASAYAGREWGSGWTMGARGGWSF